PTPLLLKIHGWTVVVCVILFCLSSVFLLRNIGCGAKSKFEEATRRGAAITVTQPASAAMIEGPMPKGGRSLPPNEALPPVRPGEIGFSAGLREKASPPRLREWFPETLLWKPEVITDNNGIANITVELADSITTWRLTASAVSADGRLGGMQEAIRVFQP